MIVRNVEEPGSFRKTVTDDSVEYEYVRTIHVNSTSDSENTIANAVAKKGDVYSRKGVVNAHALCDTVEISKTERLVYSARVHFTQKTSSTNDVPTKDKEPDPVRWPTEIEWRRKDVEVHERADAKGKPYITQGRPRVPLNELLKDAPPKQLCHAILTFTRMQASYSPVQMIRYANKVNGSPWYSCPKYTAKCLMPEAVMQWSEEMGRYYWKVTYVFEIAPEGWQVKLANFGKKCIVWSSAAHRYVTTDCRDDLGQPMTDGQFLDELGGQLSLDQIGQGKIYYLPEFYPYYTANFALLGLP